MRVGRRRTSIQLGLALAPALTCYLSGGRQRMTAGLKGARGALAISRGLPLFCRALNSYLLQSVFFVTNPTH
jgi:hypothetical protein